MPAVPLEATIEQYALRATFVANKLRTLGYFDLLKSALAVVKPIDTKLEWKFSKESNIPTDVKNKIKILKLPIALFYCHPAVIQGNPRLVTYYRCIAGMSQKGLKVISKVSSIDKIELGKADCSAENAMEISIALNRNLNLIYQSTKELSLEHTHGIMYATAGTSIDGSWRNAIGSEGERIVRYILVKHVRDSNDLKTVTLKDGSVVTASKANDDWLEINAGNLKSAFVKNGSQIIFSSEPDITCVLANGKVKAGVEIKAGLDPAAALERLGAMQKSFAQTLLDEPGAETILAASCITDQVQKRLNADGNVKRVMDLGDIITNKDGAAKRFCNVIRLNLELVEMNV